MTVMDVSRGISGRHASDSAVLRPKTPDPIMRMLLCRSSVSPSSHLILKAVCCCILAAGQAGLLWVYAVSSKSKPAKSERGTESSPLGWLISTCLSLWSFLIFREVR